MAAAAFGFLTLIQVFSGRTFGDWLARMDKSGGRVDRPAARVTQPQHAGDTSGV
jgi:hypothetical protein